MERIKQRVAGSAIGIEARHGRDPACRGSVRSTRARPRQGIALPRKGATRMVRGFNFTGKARKTIRPWLLRLLRVRAKLRRGAARDCSMKNATRYGTWLTFRVGKRLHTEETVLTASMLGRTLTISAEKKDQPLSEAFWLVASCTGFESEAEARSFGEELRRAVHLAGLGARVGVDAGDPGEDRTRSWLNADILLEPVRETHPDARLAPDVHGLVVLPDDGNNVFARARGSGEARTNAANFVGALQQALVSPGGSGDEEARGIRRAIRMLNLAEASNDSIAKLARAIAAVDGLADRQARSAGKRGESVRQRVKQMMSTYGLDEHWADWDDLYRRRSRLFHDDAVDPGEALGSYLDETELHKLGERASRLCATIILAMAKQEGLPVPDQASVYFGI